MIRSFFKRHFHMREVILLLSLPALACLPVSLGNLVRGAGLSVFLPVTLGGALLACALAASNARRLSIAVILGGLGPLALFIRIGRLEDELLKAVGQSLALLPAIFGRICFRAPFDISDFLHAREDLFDKALAVGERFWLWAVGMWYGVHIEDPMARTLVWGAGLWLAAAWGGWQVYRHRRILAGLLPSTILMAFVVDYTNREIEVLWLNLGMVLFLLGFDSFEDKLGRWIRSGVDYSESTVLETIFSLLALTAATVTLAVFVSTISIRDIFEDLREKRPAADSARTEALGLEAAVQGYGIRGTPGGLPRSHLIGSGPQLSEDLVMTVSTGELPPLPRNANPAAPRYYWRTFTYQIYTGSGWRNPEIAEEQQVSPHQALFEATSAAHRIVQQQVRFPQDRDGRLYWAGTLLQADVPFRAAWLRRPDPESGREPLLDSNLLAALAQVDSYRAESLVVQVSREELRASPAAYPAWVRNQFLGLPQRVPERVLALARDLTASERTPYDRALAIHNYLRQLPYTLDVPAPPADREVADFFLFDLKQGYCDYYATTMVVLARAAGLPARLVVGYASGSYDPESAQYLVYEVQAHSWVEVYFTDIGWVEFEPTASLPAIQFAEQAHDGPQVVPPDPGNTLMNRLGSLTREVNLRTPAILLIGVILLWAGGDTLYLLHLKPPGAMRLVYRRLRRLARPVAGISAMDQTAHQYASVLRARLSGLELPPGLMNMISPALGEIDHLTELYARGLFTSRPLSRNEARAAVQAWQRLRWRIVLANLAAGFRKRPAAPPIGPAFDPGG
jgi:hypothetical protein